MSKEQKIHAIISAVVWIVFIVELNIADGFNLWTVLFLVSGILMSVYIVKEFPSEYFLVGVCLIFVIVLAVAIPLRNRNLDIQAKAVELYEQGRYKESMDEFMKIKDTGFIDGYVEKYKYTVYELKGTDIKKVRVEE